MKWIIHIKVRLIMNAPLLITLLTDNLYSMISEYKVVHDGDNLSDHSVLQMVLQLLVEYNNESGVANRQCDRLIQWRKAQLAHLQQYRYTLDYLLDDDRRGYN